MQIFYCHSNPITAANMIPPRSRSRMLQEGAQLIAKALGLPPFLRDEYPDQGCDLADGIRCNKEYREWVMGYCDELWRLLLAGNKAPLIRDGWSRMCDLDWSPGIHLPSRHDFIPVRLPKGFRKETGWHNGLRDKYTAIVIYEQLINYKYFPKRFISKEYETVQIGSFTLRKDFDHVSK